MQPHRSSSPLQGNVSLLAIRDALILRWQWSCQTQRTEFQNSTVTSYGSAVSLSAHHWQPLWVNSWGSGINIEVDKQNNCGSNCKQFQLNLLQRKTMCPKDCVGSTGVDAHAVQQTPPLLLADRNTPLSHVIYSSLISDQIRSNPVQLITLSILDSHWYNLTTSGTVHLTETAFQYNKGHFLECCGNSPKEYNCVCLLSFMTEIHIGCMWE